MCKLGIKPIVTFFLVFWALAAGLSARAADSEQRANMARRLEAELSSTKNARDSLALMRNICDLSSYGTRLLTAERLYRASISARDTAARFEALRMLTEAWNGNDSMQAVQQHRAEMMPSSPEQRETVTFIKLLRAITATSTLSDEQRANHLHRLLAEFEADRKEDVYRRIEKLFTICLFLRERSDSKLLLSNLDKLEVMVAKLPPYPGVLQHYYYALAAACNSVAGHPADAVQHDRNLLSMLEDIESHNEIDHRPYRTFDISRYGIYQRMLGNYKALTPAEVDECHERLVQLAARNDEVRADMNRRGLASAFYAMAKGRYAEALPLLKKAAMSGANVPKRLMLLRMLIESAQKCGDDATQLWAYSQYTPLLENNSRDIDGDRIIEYRILYNINSVEKANRELADKNDVMEQRSEMLGIITLACIVLALIAVIAIQYRAMQRTRKMSQDMRRANALLMDERDNLEKTRCELIEARDAAQEAERHKSDFISNVSHELSEPVGAIEGYAQLIVDSADEGRRPIMQKFMDIITLNAQLLRTLLNDVLDASELEAEAPALKYSKEKMAKLAQLAADTVRRRLHPGVSLTVKAAPGTPEDAAIDTDASRVEQVLLNVLSNAVKFTDKGSITVEYAVNVVAGLAQFTVTDTGPGIPADKVGRLFGRFDKLDRNCQGAGLGLYVSRLITHYLDGDICLDETYTDGARFVVTLPIAKPL